MDTKLRLLLDTSAAIADEKDLHKILITLSEVTRTLLEADRGTIFLHDKDNQELWSVIAHGIPEIRIDDTKGIVGHVFHTGKTLNIQDAYQDKVSLESN